jgi:hypothetical protein
MMAGFPLFGSPMAAVSRPARRSPVPSRFALLMAGPLVVALPFPAAAAADCRFLEPIGGNGITPIVSKKVGPAKLLPAGMLLGRPNWNTDFVVDEPYRSYRFFFTATSTDPRARYPVSGTMKFTDGSSLQLFQQTLSPPVGRGREFGPFPAVPGKQPSQMNFRIGATDQPGALGFSYRISVQGCR